MVDSTALSAPCRLALACLTAIVLAPAARAALAAQRADRSAPPAEVVVTVPSQEAWRGLLTRDQTVKFTTRTPAEARALLAAAAISPERRAAALMALGCSSSEGERPRLEALARGGEGMQRLAAILALGEMNAGATSLLLEIASKADPLARECALLALLRDGRNTGRRRVEEIAYDASHPAAAAAKDLLLFTFDPDASTPTAAGTLLLRLRWEAAREFGLVEGQAWKVLAIQDLSEDPAALADIVLGAVPALSRPGVADHLLPELMSGTGTSRLRAAVAVMPRELAALIENGLWKPRDAREWRVVLDEIQDRGMERLTLEVLRAGIEVPEVRWRALELAASAGDDDLAALVDADPSTFSVEERIEFAQALGTVPDASWLTRFAALRDDADLRVRAAYLVAGMRHDQRKSQVEVEGRAADAQHPEHAATIEALARVARDTRAAVVLETRLTDLQSGPERLTIATALCRAGRLAGRATVREALSADPPPHGAQAVELVRALSGNGTSEDVEVFRALFPRPDDPALDIELARTLAEIGDHSIDALLRAALWRGNFDLSVLAAGLLLETNGPFGLVRELQNPPVKAASSDLRRVGWAVGEWGGPAEYERLLRELRTTTAHPAVQGAWLGALASRTR